MRNKLLSPGYAGELTDEELAFIKKRLKKDKQLRARWGMVKGTGRINDEKVRAVAAEGPEAMERWKSE